jgi:hypothetical protein
MADRSIRGGFFRYVGRAFKQRWNLGIFAVAGAFAALSPYPDAFLPIVLGLEGAFLLGMVANTKFRDYVDAQDLVKAKVADSNNAINMYAQLQQRLSLQDRQRFQQVVDRCEDMHRLASSVRPGAPPADEMRNEALNRLLFFYLRLLVARRSLERFLDQSNRAQLESQRAEMAKRLAASGTDADARVVSSLQVTIKDLDARIANVVKGEKDVQFLELELTRIEGKVHALAEAAITSQDPAELSAQVTAFTDTLRLSQDVASQMISLQDLELATASAPQILGASAVKQVN